MTYHLRLSHIFSALFFALFFPLAASAQSLDSASDLLRQGDYDEAIRLFREIAASKSRDAGQACILLGDAFLQTGDMQQAREAYIKARDKKVNDAYLRLAELALLTYDTELATDDLELYRKGLGKGRKALPDESGDLEDRIDRISTMLERVEQLVIIDSINVDADRFFEYYRLSPESGRLLSPDVLPPSFPRADPTVVYCPESGREIIWAAPDADNNFQLVSSICLYGDNWDTPVPLGDILNEGGDANYPFLMPDGVTLYFANDGENSLGGYDIFITRRDGNDFLQPQNLGMPYNSPFNDYMLAIDESNGIGWWATDRNQIPGEVTIYVFLVSDMRINYPVDSPDLPDRARVTSIRDTWKQGADYSPLLRKIAAIRTNSESEEADRSAFVFTLPDGRVVSSLDGFTSPAARDAMRQFIVARAALKSRQARLDALRRTYSSGDFSVAPDITDLEREILDARRELRRLSNRVVTLEIPDAAQ